jgi:spore germination cell wall hydrolase CwlJ-like protein
MKNAIILISVLSIFFTNMVKGVNPNDAESVENRANSVGLSVNEYQLFADVVEAESDRSDDIEGRIYIALTIWNRVNDPRFPNSVNEVLNQSGQFSTVHNGASVCSASELSYEAVNVAYEWIESGDAPNVLFFNCIGYNYGEPYDYIGGNYFMILEV